MYNNKIIEILSRMIVLRNFQNGENLKHQVDAYQKVISGIKLYPYEFTSAQQVVDNIEGIGSSIKSYLKSMFSIDDQFRSGISDLDKYLTEDVNFFNTIAEIARIIQIPGIGFEKAKKLYSEGKTYEQLIPLTKREVSKKSYTEELKKRIPHYKIQQFENVLRKYTNNFVITGSYRRKTETSKDIDVLLYNIDSVKLIEQLYKDGIILETLSSGNDRFDGICYLDDGSKAVRIDFLFIHKNEEFPYALLFFTGSKEFNIWIKTEAKKKGLTLGNTELYYYENKVKKNIYVNSEEEIFKYLGLQYISPEKR